MPEKSTTIEALQAENAALKEQLLRNELPAELAALVKDKVAKGLSRSQALEVAKAQIAHDKAAKTSK